MPRSLALLALVPLALSLPVFGASVFSLTNPVKLSFPIREAKVQQVAGHPAVTVNGEALFVSMYSMRSLPADEEGAAERAKLAKEFAARGLHGYSFNFDMFWGDLARNKAMMDNYMAGILAGDPLAYVIPQLTVFPTEAWTAAHPGEYELDSKGETGLPSMGSIRYQQEASAQIGQLVAYVESQPYGGHVLGYCVQMGAEGFTIAAFRNTTGDYSTAMRDAFRAWLHEQYASDADLQAAWGDQTVTRDTALVPDYAAQLAGDLGFFRDPVRARRVIDYRHSVSDMAQRGLAMFLAAAKNGSGRKKIVGTFGGYVGAAGWSVGLGRESGIDPNELNTHNTAGYSHWGKTLDNPDLDFMMANHDYYHRQVGNPFLNYNPLESIMLHGKVPFVGDDSRTYLHGNEYGGSTNLADTLTVHRRNAALLASQTGGNVWTEQSLNWLVDPPILDNLGKLNVQMQQAIRRPDTTEGIAVIIDEDAVNYEIARRDLDWVAVHKQRIYALAHCGVPIRTYLMSDLERANYPKAKCYLFLNAWYADDARIAAIAQRLKRDGNVLVWLYGAGICSPQGISAENMAKLTGITIVPSDTRWEQMISITNWQHPITANLPADARFGTEYLLSPTFAVHDPAAVTLGSQPHIKDILESALVVKSFGKGVRGTGKALGVGDYAAIYSASPALSSDLLRNIARYAGVHVYDNENDVITAGRGMLSVHAVKPGPRTIYLPRVSTVRCVDDGRIMAQNAKQFTFKVTGPQTWLFLIEE